MTDLLKGESAHCRQPLGKRGQLKVLSWVLLNNSGGLNEQAESSAHMSCHDSVI